jgi:hypothetical protein
MIGFIGTSLQLQSIIRANTLLSEQRLSNKSLWRIFGWSLLLLEFTNELPFIIAMRPVYKSTCGTVSCPLLFCWLSGESCLAICYLATTCSLLFVVVGTWFPSHCSVTDVCSGSTILAFSRHVTISLNLKSTIFWDVAPWVSQKLLSVFEKCTGSSFSFEE